MKQLRIVGQLLRVDSIDLPPEYERKASLVEDDALRQSIEKGGVQQSVVVHALRGQMSDVGSQRFVMIKGGRRLRISEHLGLHTIPAVIVEYDKDYEDDEEKIKAWRNRLRFILTQARQDLLPSQRASLIKQLMSMFGMKQKDVAAYLGVDAGSITNWLAIDKYNPEIKRAIDTGEINLHQARGFDGMTAEGQSEVWNAMTADIKGLSGKEVHRLIRSTFSPAKFPNLYVSAEKTAEKLSRKARGRATRRRPRLSHDEKDVLSRDLSLLEVELESGKQELRSLEREIKLSAQPINAIMRSKTLVAKLPQAVREEFERFVEIY